MKQWANITTRLLNPLVGGAIYPSNLSNSSFPSTDGLPFTIDGQAKYSY